MFSEACENITGFDKSAPILNAGNRRGFPYISMWNVPDTGYGGVTL